MRHQSVSKSIIPPEFKEVKVRLVPDLAAAALKRGQHKTYATWSVFRAISSDGFVDYKSAVRTLLILGLSRAGAYARLAQHHGFWSVILKNGKRRLLILGLLRVAKLLEAKVTSTRFIEVPLADFTIKCQKGVLLASVIPTNRCQLISRATIEQKTGVSRRTQIRLFQKVGVTSVSHLLVDDTGFQIRRQVTPEFCKSQPFYTARLPNSFRTPSQFGVKHMHRRLVRELRRGGGAENGRGTQPPRRHFFNNLKGLCKARAKGATGFMCYKKSPGEFVLFDRERPDFGAY
ncbi:hypothetical protein Dform_00817 [Dehalogenimonas formicexedens]|uniref:Uncharacterized protein n=1 Tax=Dehalogenimonas formicexedens TaxID=1839801 RepID=A0A1P8F6W3_9CHLR|nr:hypothetical protein [Dehalogenimonas formicexedens]APV44165.1 hypothetical protein Dform_00817 [Dehalogenimonas formicexedens]